MKIPGFQGLAFELLPTSCKELLDIDNMLRKL